MIEQFATKHGLRLSREVDGTNIVRGKVGHIYEYNDELLGVLVMPTDRSQNKLWGYARSALVRAGLQLTQDGDTEGSAVFDPNDEKQVRAVIKVAVIRKRRKASSAQLANLSRTKKSLDTEAVCVLGTTAAPQMTLTPTQSYEAA
jgi:hypothetical protein